MYIYNVRSNDSTVPFEVHDQVSIHGGRNNIINYQEETKVVRAARMFNTGHKDILFPMHQKLNLKIQGYLA